MTQATGSSFFTQAMALATTNTASTTLPELIAFMGNRLGQTRANQLLAKVGHLLTLEQQYTLQETYLYGSSRLGVKNQNTILSTRIASVQNGSLTPIGNAILNTDSVFTGTAAVYGLPKAPTARIFNRTWGLKQYELSNHLGNVQVTVSDKKHGVVGANQEDFIAYEPEVKSATDNYAYGMEMPGKTYQSTAYRYGMNTQEKDNEIYGPGNTLGALYWEYDARIARRWNVDPVVKEYEGGYTTFSGNPIWFVDINGDDSLKVNPETGNPTVQLPVLTVSAERVEPVNSIFRKLIDKVPTPLISTELKENSELSTTDKTGYILNSFGTANSAKTEIMDLFVKSNSANKGLKAELEVLGKSGTRYLEGAKNFGKLMSWGGVAVSALDAGIKGKWENHHTADVLIGVGSIYLLTGPVGWTVGAGYFLLDASVKAYTNKSITENLFD